MKLLFDQNISWRVLSQLADVFPEAKQVRDLELVNRTDREIWEFAKQNGCSIVTFDADFYDFVTLYGHPPKVIWLRIGNTSTRELVEVLRSHSAQIIEFLTDTALSEISCLEIVN